MAAAVPDTPRRAARPGTIRALAASCHPLPTVAVTLVSGVLAAGVGLPPQRVVLLTVAVLAGQLSIGWSNDRLDAARDAAVGRGDKPAAAGRVPLRLLTVAAAVALLAAVVLSLLLGAAAGAALLVLVAAGWAYNLGLKATPWSALAYAVGFGALPVAPWLALPDPVLPAWWVPVCGALLGIAAHVANVLPDLRDDEATGVRGLPHRLGVRRSTVLLALALAAATVVLALGPPRPVPVAVAGCVLGVLGAAAVALLARRRGGPWPFRAVLVLVVLDVVLLVALF